MAGAMPVGHNEDGPEADPGKKPDGASPTAWDREDAAERIFDEEERKALGRWAGGVRGWGKCSIPLFSIPFFLAGLFCLYRAKVTCGARRARLRRLLSEQQIFDGWTHAVQE